MDISNSLLLQYVTANGGGLLVPRAGAGVVFSHVIYTVF